MTDDSHMISPTAEEAQYQLVTGGHSSVDDRSLQDFHALNNQVLPEMVDRSMHIQPEQAETLRQQRVGSHKFFQSKIDFSAPVRQLQAAQNYRIDPGHNQLSDDNDNSDQNMAMQMQQHP
jgi:hypothetical protein